MSNRAKNIEVLNTIAKMCPNKPVHELYLLCVIADCTHASKHRASITGTQYYKERSDIMDAHVFYIIEWGTFGREIPQKYLSVEERATIEQVCQNYGNLSHFQLFETALQKLGYA